MSFTNNQEKTLNLLLDKYENSKTYRGTNLTKQSFVISPEKVWSKYSSDYANVEQVKDFENDMHTLEEEGLITLQWKYNTIVKICACENKFQDYYKKLDRKEKKNFIYNGKSIIFPFFLGFVKNRSKGSIQTKSQSMREKQQKTS